MERGVTVADHQPWLIRIFHFVRWAAIAAHQPDPHDRTSCQIRQKGLQYSRWTSARVMPMSRSIRSSSVAKAARLQARACQSDTFLIAPLIKPAIRAGFADRRVSAAVVTIIVYLPQSNA